MARPARARINLDAFLRNLQLARQCAKGASVAAVIKADGYGHGIVPVARIAEQAGCMLAVASIEEAVRVRHAQVQAPVLLLEGFFHVSELEEWAFNDLQWVIHSDHQLLALERRARESGQLRSVSVWLKFNTGMNRLGLLVADADQLARRISCLPGVRLLGVMTHFACADELASCFSAQQVDGFKRAMTAIEGVMTGVPLKRSLCNSAGVLYLSDFAGDLVRPGIMLYGSSPVASRSAVAQGLQAVMTLESALISVNQVASGECVGYGLDWCAARPSRVGIVAMGYADGYPRHAPSGTPVWILGTRVPLVGRVSMDMLAVDLTDCEKARVGDLVELWGENVSVDEVAACAGTLGYELLTGVSARVPRIY